MKNDSLFLGILYNRRSHFAPPSMGRKWVVGADSSHTEISVIVWLCVTSTPQWQQLLINPTSHHPALPTGGFSPKLFPLNFLLCVWLRVFGWCGGGDFSNCSLSTHAHNLYSYRRTLLSLFCTSGSRRQPANCVHVFKPIQCRLHQLCLQEFGNCDWNYVSAPSPHEMLITLWWLAYTGSGMLPLCCTAVILCRGAWGQRNNEALKCLRSPSGTLMNGDRLYLQS